MNKPPVKIDPTSLKRPRAVAGAVRGFSPSANDVAQFSAVTRRLGLSTPELFRLLVPDAGNRHFDKDGIQLLTSRLKDLLLVLDRVGPWCIDDADALRWFSTELLPAFGNDTPADIVRKGQAGALMEHLEAFAVGGFA